MYHTYIIDFYPIAIWWFDDNFWVNNTPRYCVIVLNVYYIEHKLIVNRL